MRPPDELTALQRRMDAPGIGGGYARLLDHPAERPAGSHAQFDEPDRLDERLSALPTLAYAFRYFRLGELDACVSPCPRSSRFTDVSAQG